MVIVAHAIRSHFLCDSSRQLICKWAEDRSSRSTWQNDRSIARKKCDASTLSITSLFVSRLSSRTIIAPKFVSLFAQQKQRHVSSFGIQRSTHLPRSPIWTWLSVDSHLMMRQIEIDLPANSFIATTNSATHVRSPEMSPANYSHHLTVISVLLSHQPAVVPGQIIRRENNNKWMNEWDKRRSTIPIDSRNNDVSKLRFAQWLAHWRWKDELAKRGGAEREKKKSKLSKMRVITINEINSAAQHFA